MRVPSVSTLLVFALAMPFSALAQTARLTAPPLDPIHDSDEWRSIAAHLPDLQSATHDKLELTGDVLRARKYEVDAMQYYQYAMNRGGDKARLTNKVGLIQLELNDHRGARLSFQAALKIRKKFPEAWNNLGTLDYLDGRYGNAISDYKKAIKEDKHSAVFHSNLGAAYFSQKDMESAQKELAIALKIDPDMYNHRGRGGVATQVISATDRAKFCFELARVYAKHDDTRNMYHYLAKAAESGMDVTSAVKEDIVFKKYLKEPQLTLMLRDTRAFLMAIESPAPQLPEPGAASTK